MAPEKHTVSSPPAPDAKRRREDPEQDPPINPNAAKPVLQRENAIIGANFKTPQSLDDVFALFESRADDDDEEDEDEDSDDEHNDDVDNDVKDDPSGDDDVEEDDVVEDNVEEYCDERAVESVDISPIVELSKSVRSFKPPGARDPKAARKEAASMDPRRFLKLNYGLLHSKSKNGIPGYTASKEGRKPLLSQRAAEMRIPDNVGNVNPSSTVPTPNESTQTSCDGNLDPGSGHTDELENMADVVGSLITPRTDIKRSTIKEVARDTGMKQAVVKVQSDATSSDMDVVKQSADSGLPLTLKPVRASTPGWAPLSHKPIYSDEPGHGRFKSRIVFEADPVPQEQYYAETTYGIATSSRISALEKLKEWRQNFGGKMKDGQLRKAERLVVLNEHEPSMARNDLSRYTDSLKTLDKWLAQFMPDSFVVVKTTIPANAHTKAGRFVGYIEALRQLMAKRPFHFSVELEDKSILTIENASDAHLASAINFVHSVEFFRAHGHLTAGNQKPFSTMKSKKKPNKNTPGSINPEREAKNVTAFLPWIPESFARKHYVDCAAFPDQDLGPLEFEQTGTNPVTLMPQEVIGHIASMDKSLFTTSAHASQSLPFENCKMGPYSQNLKGAINSQTERIAEDKERPGKPRSVIASPASHGNGGASSAPFDTSNIPAVAYDSDSESSDEDELEPRKVSKLSEQTDYDPFNYHTHYGQQSIVFNASIESGPGHDSNVAGIEHHTEVGSENASHEGDHEHVDHRSNLEESIHSHTELEGVIEDDLAEDIWAAFDLPGEDGLKNEYNDSLFDGSDNQKEEPERSKSLSKSDTSSDDTTESVALAASVGAAETKARHKSDESHDSFKQNVPGGSSTTHSIQEQPALTTPCALGTSKKRKKKSKAQKNAEKARAAQGQKDQIDLGSLQQKAAKEQEEISKKRERDRIWAEYSRSSGVNGAGPDNFSDEEEPASKEHQPDEGDMGESPSDETDLLPKSQEDRTPMPKPVLTQDAADIEPVSWDSSTGDYVYRIVFRSTDVPVDAIYLELKDQGELEWHEAGERKLKVDGKKSKKYWKGDGAHLTKSFLRKNAAAKLIEWRDSRKVGSLGEDVRRKLRERVHITLDMGPPNGPLGDAAFFAESIATLRKRLLSLPKWLPKADFLLKLSVPNDIFVKHPLGRSGFLKYWDEVRETLLTFPTRFVVELTDSSITDARLNEWWDETDKAELARRVNEALKKLYTPVYVKAYHEQNLDITEGTGKDKQSIRKNVDPGSTTALPTTVQGVDAMLSYFGYTEKSLKSRIEAEMSSTLEIERQQYEKRGGNPREIRFDEKLLNKRVHDEIAEFEALRRKDIVAKCESTVSTPKSIETAIKLGTTFVEDVQYFQEHGRLPDRSDSVEVTVPAAQAAAPQPSSKPTQATQDQHGPGANKLGIWIPQTKADGSFAVRRYERKTQKILVEMMDQRGLPTEEFKYKLERAAVLAADDEGTFWTAYNNAKAEETKALQQVPGIASRNPKFDRSHSLGQGQYLNKNPLPRMPTASSVGTLDKSLLHAKVPGAGLRDSFHPDLSPYEDLSAPLQLNSSVIYDLFPKDTSYLNPHFPRTAQHQPLPQSQSRYKLNNQTSNRSQWPAFPSGVQFDLYPLGPHDPGVQPALGPRYASQGKGASTANSSHKPPTAPNQLPSAANPAYNVEAQYIRGRIKGPHKNTTFQHDLSTPPTASAVGPGEFRGKKRGQPEYKHGETEVELNDRVSKKHAGERDGSQDITVKPLIGQVLESRGHPPSSLGKHNSDEDQEPSERPRKKPVLSMDDATSAAPRKVLRPQSRQGQRNRVNSDTERLRQAHGRSALQEPLLQESINMAQQPTTEQYVLNSGSVGQYHHDLPTTDQAPNQGSEFQLSAEDWQVATAGIEAPPYHYVHQYGASQPGGGQYQSVQDLQAPHIPGSEMLSHDQSRIAAQQASQRPDDNTEIPRNFAEEQYLESLGFDPLL
ncbi:hypothetical protein SLS60_009606 [Paraconiothyrium brasiliense]|uniref:Uncharacterized protein n=1 Tax=Paraconiothyrium brasiliense TaxID=300254 RepID=A0ABR3QUR8_9PLEO